MASVTTALTWPTTCGSGDTPCLSSTGGCTINALFIPQSSGEAAASATNNYQKALVAQYGCLYQSIFSGLLPTILAQQEQIRRGNADIQTLKNSAMLGFVTAGARGGQDGVPVNTGGTPRYAQAFIALCVTFGAAILVCAVIPLLQWGVSLKTVGVSAAIVFASVVAFFGIVRGTL